MLLDRPAASVSVSNDEEPLILVDVDDRPTGSASKRLCHDGEGLLHRAFSVFLFRDDGSVLLQQRSSGKRLWPLYWSNACCSHPRLGEETAEAARRRMGQELGLETPLHYVYKFRYQASYGAAGSEHELCWVFVGRTSTVPVVHPEEVAAYRNYAPDELDTAVEETPGIFTPWFLMEWWALRGEYFDRVQDLLCFPPSGLRAHTPVSPAVT
ncbi:MAG: isopentenyl-diphosphate Delta-isomerase [Gammaproteobacteria bacterium]|nr:isopentenyl-diphosphate Delta-isomerase [Gammaproteobacteria bacterium]